MFVKYFFTIWSSLHNVALEHVKIMKSFYEESLPNLMNSFCWSMHYSMHESNCTFFRMNLQWKWHGMAWHGTTCLLLNFKEMCVFHSSVWFTCSLIENVAEVLCLEHGIYLTHSRCTCTLHCANSCIKPINISEWEAVFSAWCNSFKKKGQILDSRYIVVNEVLQHMYAEELEDGPSVKWCELYKYKDCVSS